MAGEAQTTPDLIAAIDACLGCRACETACPSAVRYGTVLEHFRGRIEDRGARNKLAGDAKRGLIGGMGRPGLFSVALGASRALSALDRILHPSHARTDPTRGLPRPIAGALSGGSCSETLMPEVPTDTSVHSLPAYAPAVGPRRYTVAVLQGCVMRVLYHRTNVATVRVLQHAGCDVICPPGLGCCGALDMHAGYRANGIALARDMAMRLADVACDAFVINSAGCGSTIREYGEILAEDPIWAHAGSALAAKARDISEFLDQIGIPGQPGLLDATVTYHDACHLAHGQGITAAPRRLLEGIAGLRAIPLHESAMCCGSAGTYNLTQPDMARRLLERKVDNIVATGADIVAMGNPGCMAWIARGLRERGSPIRVLHVAEILEAAYCAERRPNPPPHPTTVDQ
jgi:glycolate oxidase iron-sulfur subunit